MVCDIEENQQYAPRTDRERLPKEKHIPTSSESLMNSK